jgi:ActR/RegA family two-component response regulator
LLKYIRGNTARSGIVTGMGDEETAVNALKASADDYLAMGKVILLVYQSYSKRVNHFRANAARRSHP